MAFRLQHDDIHLNWQGAISLERTAGWTMPWRIPQQERDLYAPMLAERAAMPAGVRLSFYSDTTSIAAKMIPSQEPGLVDLVCDGVFMGSAPVGGVDSFLFQGLPPSDKLIELWLPQFGEFRLCYLDLDEGASLVPTQDARPRWITYGSSITQCRTAASPTQTWPAIVARERGLNLTCLGLGGQCHLDPLMARLIRDQAANFISLCVGINIYGGATLGERTFRWNLIGFVQIIREKHPNTPLVVMSPIYSPPREEIPNAVGLTLRAMRAEVAEAVRLLREQGDAHIHYVDGLEILGRDLAHLLHDELHPDAEGYRAMGRNFSDQVVAVYYQRMP